MNPEYRRWSRGAKCAMWIGGWTAFGLFFTTHTSLNEAYQGHPPRWLWQLTRWLVYSYIYCALTPIILRTARRYPFERGTWLRRIPIHVAVSIGVALLATLVCGPVAYLLTSDPGTPFAPRILVDLFVIAFQYHLLIYWAIVGLEHGIEFYRRYQEREIHAGQLQAQLAQAQLDALRMQLHPHFLFNTLNSVSVLMQTDVQAAKHTLVCLSHLLRGALQASQGHEVALKHEVELLRSYLEIERTRFQDRLTASVRVDPEALDARVPYFILQPLVENAIRHGEAGRIEITASRENGNIRLEVADDGTGIKAGASRSSGNGIGLANTRARLEKLYGAAHSFELRNAPEGGVVAAVTIPFHVGDATQAEPATDEPWTESAY
jgi:signal transduction histidine kinase